MAPKNLIVASVILVLQLASFTSAAPTPGRELSGTASRFNDNGDRFTGINTNRDVEEDEEDFRPRNRANSISPTDAARIRKQSKILEDTTGEATREKPSPRAGLSTFKLKNADDFEDEEEIPTPSSANRKTSISNMNARLRKQASMNDDVNGEAIRTPSRKNIGKSKLSSKLTEEPDFS